MPAFGFVADDLTGAADVLAQSHRYGLEAALVIGDEADELARDATLLLPDERVASDELALGELYEPAEVRLERRRRIVDVDRRPLFRRRRWHVACADRNA